MTSVLASTFSRLLLLGLACLALGAPSFVSAASPIKVYVVSGSSTTAADALIRVDADGTGQTTLANDVANFGNPEGIAIDYGLGYIFVADGNTGQKILRYNLDGTGRTVIHTVTHVGLPRALAIDPVNQKIYFTTSSNISTSDRLTRINYDGSGETTLASDVAHFQNPTGLSIDTVRGHLYVSDNFASGTSAGFLRYNLDGTGRTVMQTWETLRAGATGIGISGSAVDRVTGEIYLCVGSGTATSDRVWRMNNDGSGLTTLVSDVANFFQPTSIVLDRANGYFYVGDAVNTTAPSQFLRFNLNGTGRTVIGAGLANGCVNGGIALYSSAPTISDVANQNVAVNGNTGALSVTVGDGVGETPAASLIMMGRSSNTTLVPDANIVFGGSGTARTVTVTPATGQSGSATITLEVFDGVRFTTDTFTVTVASMSAPTVTTSAQSAVTATSASLGGNVTADGGATVTERGIVWKTSTGPTTADNKVQNGSGTGVFSGTVTGLPAGTTVFVRAYAINSVNTSYGNEISFTTLTLPTITTGAATGVTGASAVLNGSANANGSTTTLTYEWGLTTSYGNTVSMGTTGGAPASLPNTISGLTPGTVYHFRLVGVSAAGTTNGADQSFTTLSSNADLSALTTTATGMTPVFGAATTAYTATVPNATATTTVTATRAEANATLQVQVNGGGFSALTSGSPSSSLALNVGANPIDVKVTAQDGTTIKTYTITVTRAAPAAEIPMTLSGGALTIDASGSIGAANVTLSFVTGPGGPFLEITDTSRTLGAPAGGTQVSPNTVRVPISSISNLVLNGSPLADTFTFNLADGDFLPPGGLTVNGGAPSTPPGDIIAVDGAFASMNYDATNVGAGTVDLGIGTIAFTGIEPLDFSGATISGTLTVNVDPGSTYAGNVITTIAAVDAGVNTEVTFGASGLESIKFGAVTGAVVINGDNVEQDYFLLTGLGSAMVGTFTLDGKGGDSDVIEINNTAVTVAGVDKAVVLRADFVGVGRANQDVNTGVLNFKGPLTIEANGDFAVATPLWGASGVWGASAPAYFPSTANLIARGNVIIRGDLNKIAGADATVLIKATAAITTTAPSTVPPTTGGRIISTSNKAHIVLNADSDANSLGNVNVGILSTLTSNGGDITIGGGANPATTPAFGFSSGGSALTPGVVLQQCAITSGGGAISIRGNGAAVSGGHGIILVSGSSTNATISSGAGNINMVGTSGALSGLHGITQQNSATTDTVISSTTGQISLTGTASLANGDGIRLVGRTSITGTGAAPISLTGTGAGTGMGIMMTPASGQTTTVSSSSSVTLIADKMNLSGGVGTESINAVSSSVRLMPRTGGVLVNLGSSVDTTASTLEISAAELDNVNAGSIEVADGGLFPITVSAVIAPLNFKTLFLLSSTTFSATGGFASDVTSSSVFEQLVVFSTVSITSGATLTMSSAGGYIWNGTDTFRVIDNDAGDAITGTFTGPTLTNFLGSSLTAQQTYTGGTGNDLVFFAPPSSNADLSALALSSGTLAPVFGAATTAYTASVSNATSSVTVTATRAQANATLQVQVNGGGFNPLTSATPSGALALNIGSNTIEVKVTAQDTTTIKTYTTTVTRRSILQDWRFDNFAGDFSGSANMANGLDFDLDGKTNLLEFAFGTDPKDGGSGPPDLTMTGTYAAAVFGVTGQPITKLEPIANGVDYRAVFIRRADHAAAGLTYTPEFSADNFTSFTPSATVPTVLATSGSYQLVSVPYPHFLPNGKKARFFRVSISIAP